MTNTPLRAYHGDPAVKAGYLERMRAHRAAEELLQDYGYWHDNKGCAIGCTVHSSDPNRFETQLGIPRLLAYLEERFFESLPKAMALAWPEQFLEAIPVGADLTQVPDQLLLWLFGVEGLHLAVYPTVPQHERAAMERIAALLHQQLMPERLSPEEVLSPTDWDALLYSTPSSEFTPLLAGLYINRLHGYDSLYKDAEKQFCWSFTLVERYFECPGSPMSRKAYWRAAVTAFTALLAHAPVTKVHTSAGDRAVKEAVPA